MGDPSEVPEPTGKEAPKLKGSKDVEDDPKDSPTAVKAPGTKAGIIHAAMQKMNAMSTKQLKAQYGGMMDAMDMKAEEVETEERDTIVEAPKVTSDDIDVAEDIRAMFESDESLSEDFKTKAATVFEAAVVSKINEQLEKISANFESELDEEIQNVKTEMAEQLDSYLDYVVEQWMGDNALAVEQGIKAEMVESFMGGMKSLFEEHYVNIPDEKVDVVEEMATRAEELEESLNEEISRNVELRKIVESYTKEKLIESTSSDLTETQKAKFKTLAEGIDYSDNESFVQKLEVIKESYFGQVEEATTSYDFDESEPLEEEVTTKKVSDPSMAAYVDAISRSIK
jgi:hypothetical protein